MNIYPIQAFKERKDEILNLLSQLTSAPIYDDAKFNNIINNLNNTHKIFVYFEKDKIVGMITLLLEQKLIRGGAYVAHIEDLVVDKDYRGMGIANKLINYCIELSSRYNTYKIILDCDIKLQKFYEKMGFECKNIQMSKYN